jgi:DNA-binding SARP family transcriptional activator
MEFGILGPLAVTDGEDRPVDIRGPRQRTLLTVLLLHANEVVSRDRLIEDLWEGDPPGTAATALHGYVSQLRKALEPQAAGGEQRLLLTRSPGYVLRVDPERLDLTRFENLVREGKRALVDGEAHAASATLAGALALWRGPPLSEFASAPFALAERLRLEELRLSALEERVEADLGLGRHTDVVPELEALVAEHPLRERFRGQLMLALYRSGRQAEALEAYRRGRQTLVNELGIEPGGPLQELEKAILNHDPALEPPTGRARDGAVTTDRVSWKLPRRSLVRRLALAMVAVAVVAGALALGVAFDGRTPAAMLLEPNSVGFVDAAEGRVTRSYPVGRDPRALLVAFDSLWVANHRDQTVTRVRPDGGRSVTIVVGAHPTGLAAHQGMVWVSSLEGRLIPIDPRVDSAGPAIELLGSGAPADTLGEIAQNGRYLWVAAPPVAVIRVDPARPRDRLLIVPDAGAGGAIELREGKAWIAGSSEVVPMDAESGALEPGIAVGTPVRDLTFAAGTLWVISGGPARRRTLVALRRIDIGNRLVETTIHAGDDPIAVAASGDSIWVAGRSDGTITRVDPTTNLVVDSIATGASPTAIVASDEGAWFAVG